MGGFVILYAVDNIPNLKAQLLEYINPSVKEARLLDEVQTIQESLEKDIETNDNLSPEIKKTLTTKIIEIKNKTQDIKNINNSQSSIPQIAIREATKSIIDTSQPIINRIENIFKSENNIMTTTQPTSQSPTISPIPSPCQ